jgi:hypothetical protein
LPCTGSDTQIGTTLGWSGRGSNALPNSSLSTVTLPVCSILFCEKQPLGGGVDVWKSSLLGEPRKSPST